MAEEKPDSENLGDSVRKYPPFPTTAEAEIATALKGENYESAMKILANLRAPVDKFFDEVTVNCNDSNLRVNRLLLLSQIRSALGGVADFSLIEG